MRRLLLVSALLLLSVFEALAQTALRFNGTNQYVTFGAAPGLGTSTFTLETWFRRDGVCVTTSTGTGGVTGVPLVAKGRGEAETPANLNMNYFFGIDTTKKVLVADFENNTGGGNHPVYGTTPIALGVWYHAAATYDGTTWRLYLNGVLDTTKVVNATPEASSIQHASLGTAMTSAGAAAGYFNGALDEVRIWNYARSQSEILNGLAAEITSGAGLLGRWGLNEGVGTTAANSISGGVNGTLVNTPTWVTGSPFALSYGLAFGSGTAYVTFGDPAPLDLPVFTIETWFKRDGTGSTASTGTGGVTAIPLVAKGVGEAENSNVDANYFLGIRSSDNVLCADFEEDNTGLPGNTPGLNHPVTGITPIVNGTWYHAAVTYDGNKWQLFLNGALERELVVGQPPRANSIQHAGLGAALNSTGAVSGHFYGTLDEVRIWNYPRTQGEILSTVNSQLSTPPTGLVARWGLNEGGGTTVGSTAGATISGTIMNTGWNWITAAPFNLVAALPAAPTGLTATASIGTQIVLQWTDNADNETGFRIQRSTGGGQFDSIATVSANVTTYTDAGLAASTTYDYRVRAVNAIGLSDFTAASASTPTQPNNALVFGTGNAYVTFGQATSTLGLSQFTLETWFRRDGTGAITTTGSGGITNAIPLVTKGRGEQDASNVDMNYFLGIRSSDNVLCADFEEGAAGTTPGLNHPVAGVTTILIGVWYHAAATYDGSKWQLFLNGVLETELIVGQPPQAASIQHAALGTALISDGSQGASPIGHFDGVLDEVRIWGFARTQTEILSTINSQLDAPQTGLVARWGLNEGTGTIIQSSAGTAINGTITNTGWSWGPGSPFSIPNAAPTASGVAINGTAEVGQLLTGSYTYHDAEGDPEGTSTFRWLRNDTPIPGATTLTYTVTPSDVATSLKFEVTPEASSGTTPGLPVQSSSVIVGAEALAFGSGNAHVTFGSAATLNAATFTLETWFMRQGHGSGAYTGTSGVAGVPLITKGMHEADGSTVDMNYFLGIDTTTGVLVADFEEGTAGTTPGLNHPVSGVTPILDNQWYHAAVTYDGTKWQLFLNGLLERELAVGQPPQSSSTQHAGLGVALNSSGATEGHFNGVLDEVRIWNVARTATELRSTINQKLSTGRSGLIGRWSLDGNASASAGTTVDGTLVGTGSAWTAGAPFNVQFGNPPNQPALVGPANGSTNVLRSPTLAVAVSDPDGGNLTVSFLGKTAGSAPGPDFALAVLPDAQYYTASLNGGLPAIFNSQTQWCVDNRSVANIAYVSMLGDITETNATAQWQNGNTAMSILESPAPGIPYGIALGNHDMSNPPTQYESYFGVSRFAGRPYYGGHYGSDNLNHYELFSASGMDFIVLTFGSGDTGPAAAVLHWGDGVLKTYSSRRAIVVSHYLIGTGNPGSFASAGQVIYDSLKDNSNLFLMLCGHVDGEGQRVDTDNGHTVYTLLSDYQGRTNGGNGWMRILEFSPANSQIRVRTYSPTLNQYETDANSQFTLSYPMAGSSFQVIGTNTGVLSGSNTSVVWPGLAGSTEYEWYATVSDGLNATTGLNWGFTTIGASSTSITSSLNPSQPGEGVTFTATILPPTATGFVQFRVDGADFGVPVAVTGGSAVSQATNALAEGTHPVVAVYSGDATHEGSTSPTVTQTVAPSVQYTLTVYTVGSGTVALGPPGGTYTAGTVVTLTATPSSGWTFSGWAGDATGSTNPVTVTMNANRVVTATFNDPTLVGYWKFDETSGTVAADASGRGNNGTVTAGTWTTGKVGGGLSFNGTSAFVDLGNPTALRLTGSATWAAWVYAAANPADDGQIISKSGTSDGWQLKTSPDTGPHTFGIAVSNGSSHVARYSSTTRLLNVWYHVAGVYNASARTLDIYVNGVLNNGTLTGTVPASQNDPALNVNIGRRSGGFYFNGILDEIRVYNRILTAQEIQSIMTPGPATYTLTADVVGNGNVTANPAGGTYISGTDVTVNAVPATGWLFGGWSGALTGSASPSTITMDGNKSVTATFVRQSTDAVKFAAFGDFGSGGTQAGNVAALVKSLNPELILTTGDNNYSGVGTTAGWDNVVGKFYGQQYVHYPSGSTSAYAPGPASNAFYPTYGNHDADFGFASQAAYFELPGNERYYTFVKGPVQFFAIDSDTREPDGTSSSSVQAQWLQAQLAASTAPWKVVFMHQTPYSSGTTHGGTAYMQWPYEQWGADAVLAGHEHNMERIIRDENADGKNFAYFVTGAGGQSLYSFGTAIAGSEFRYYANYGTLLVDATTTSMTFRFYSLANPSSPVDSYTMLKTSEAGTFTETFNSFPTGQSAGSQPGWFDGGAGPLVQSSNGVPNGSGAATQGLDASGTIFTWSAHPFRWTDLTMQEVTLGMDFRTDATGAFDDDRVCWNINQSTDSRYNFGIQLDNPDGGLVTYWRTNIDDESTGARVQTPIVTPAPTFKASTWYRLRAKLVKIAQNAARIDASLTELDGFGNETGTPIAGTVTNTSTWSGGAPDVRYFSASSMWPAFKNHTTAAGPADNAYAQVVLSSTPMYSLTTTVGGAGSVTLDPSGGIYAEGASVTITAVPASGWTFSSWSGALTGSANPAIVVMDGNKTVTAAFAAEPGGESVKFAAFGDFGSGGTQAGNVAALVKSLNPELILTTGDNNYSGVGTTAGWDNVVGKFYGQQYVHYPLGSTSAYAPGPASNAFYPTYGNHDADFGFASQAAYFELPGNERYYTFVKGPVQFFAIDSDTREPDGTSSSSVQAQWLQAQLAASTAPWKVVFMHQTPYSSGTTHGGTAYMQWPYEQWGADAVLAGHEHNMERIIRDENADGKNFAYFVTGAGGQSLYSFGTAIAGSEFQYYANYGTLLVDATTTSMTFRFYSLANPSSPVDSYTMVKSTPLHPGDVIIAALQGTNTVSGQGSASEFVTLFNTTAQPISLESMNLISRMDPDGSGASPVGVDWQLSSQSPNLSGKVIAPHAFFLVGEAGVAAPSGLHDVETSLDMATGEGGIAERAISLELVIGGVHMDYVVYGRHNGSDGASPAGDLTFDGSTWPRAEVVRNTRGTDSFLDGLLSREGATALYAGYNVPGYYTDEVALGSGYPAGVWTSPHSETYGSYQARNSLSPAVLPVGPFTLNVATVGSGTVALSPTGGSYVSGTPVTLTAQPSGGWVLNAWSGDLTGNINPATVTMDANKSVIATFITGLANQWSAAINVSNSVASQSLVYGQDGRATNGIDALLAEAELPPLPPSATFDTRFILPVTPSVGSLRDFRDSALVEAIWVIAMQAGEGGYPITLRWDSTAFPYGTFLLKDRITGSIVNVDMKVHGSYILTNAGLASLQIEYYRTICTDVTVAGGWNLVSVPLEALSMNVTGLFPGAISVPYGFDNGYVESSTLERGKGYWLKFPSVSVVPVCGRDVAGSIPLAAGWNIIGPFAAAVQTTQISTTPPGIIASEFFGFAGGYVTASQLQVGKGYWVKTSQAGSMTMTGGVGKAIAAASGKTVAPVCLQFTDNAGRRGVLFLTPADQDNGAGELPPVPPGGIFDVRFGSNRQSERIAVGSHQIFLSSVEYPLTLVAQNIGKTLLRLRDPASGKILSNRMDEGKLLTLDRPYSRLSIESLVEEVPTEYVLHQNYPNPFNPATTIKIGIPEDGRVRLLVYNLIGEMVAEVTNEVMAAGYHEITFDAGSLASGIYFYRVEANHFAAIKKMLLIK